MEWLEAGQIAALEPRVKAVRGLLSPSTGIVDSHGSMSAVRRDASALRRDAEERGAHVILASPVLGGRATAHGIELRIGGSEASNVPQRLRGLTTMPIGSQRAGSNERAWAAG